MQCTTSRRDNVRRQQAWAVHTRWLKLAICVEVVSIYLLTMLLISAAFTSKLSASLSDSIAEHGAEK